MSEQEQTRILVSGDVVVDNHLYVGERRKPFSGGRGTRLERVWGGAKLTHGILKHLASAMAAEQARCIAKEVNECDKAQKKLEEKGYKAGIEIEGKPLSPNDKLADALTKYTPHTRPVINPTDAKDKKKTEEVLFEADFGLPLLDEPCCLRNESFGHRTCHQRCAEDECAAGTVTTGSCSTSNEATSDAGALHCYAVWQPAKVKKGDGLVWRAKSPLGYGEGGGRSFDFTSLFETGKTPPSGENDKVIVLEDAGLGFRNKGSNGIAAWPGSLNKTLDADQRIVLKMSAPLCSGELWDTLAEHNLDRLVAVVSIGDLRSAGARVERAVSWERTAIDIIRELNHRRNLRPLLKCRHLIITVAGEGAIWFERNDSRPDRDATKPVWRLYFDNLLQEGEWPEDGHEYEVFGFLSCFTASLAAHLAIPPVRWKRAQQKNKNSNDVRISLEQLNAEKDEVFSIDWAIRRGLLGMRALFTAGHGPADPAKSSQSQSKPGFPFTTVAEVIAGNACGNGKDPHHFADIEIPPSVVLAAANSTVQEQNVVEPDIVRNWQILTQKPEPAYKPRRNEVDFRNEMVQRLARRVALYGTQELQNVPCARYGDFITADRYEVESLQILRRLVRQYKDTPSISRPLSIAVFGQPGAGKSFAVKQLVKELLDNPKCLEFNLSQFESEKDLIAALHQVRDKAIEGSLPVAFWDEFDTERLRWLKSFLAPMQDGKFVDGQITHPVGRCLFVFAGGCYYSMADMEKEKDDCLAARASGKANQPTNDNHPDFIDSKGPDFISRLAGSFNVSGPNPTTGRGTDASYPVRRALLIRGVRRLDDGKFFDMDRKLLMAILAEAQYLNGSRSLERLLDLLCGASKGAVTQSAVPPIHALRMYVDKPAEFINCLDAGDDLEQVAEALAPYVHACYADNEVAEARTAYWMREFSELRDDVQQDNVAAVRRMLTSLHSNNSLQFSVVPRNLNDEVDPNDSCKQAVEQNIKYLAELEHNEWMEEKYLNGYRYAKVRDESRRKHSSLVPYDELDDADRERDKENVDLMLKVVDLAGYKFTKR